MFLKSFVCSIIAFMISMPIYAQDNTDTKKEKKESKKVERTEAQENALFVRKMIKKDRFEEFQNFIDNAKTGTVELDINYKRGKNNTDPKDSLVYLCVEKDYADFLNTVLDYDSAVEGDAKINQADLKAAYKLALKEGYLDLANMVAAHIVSK
jgi:hypothetical protein